eukprot:gene21837-26280_t
MSQTFHDLLPHTATPNDSVHHVHFEGLRERLAKASEETSSHTEEPTPALQQPAIEAAHDFARVEKPADSIMSDSSALASATADDDSSLEGSTQYQPDHEAEEETDPAPSPVKLAAAASARTPTLRGHVKEVAQSHSSARAPIVTRPKITHVTPKVAAVDADEQFPTSETRASEEPSRCHTDADCGGHGGCRGGKCLCSVFYKGPECKTPIDMPLAFSRPPLSNFSARFEGAMTLSQRKTRTRKKLIVHLPGKENESDKGWRVLAEDTALQSLIEVLPEEDPLTAEFFDSCAIVGSSGILMNYEHGRQIDEHDMVFRFNSAPTKGYERHVGRKTTHRITNTQNFGFRESDDESLFIHYRAKTSSKGLF